MKLRTSPNLEENKIPKDETERKKESIVELKDDLLSDYRSSL
jgi:hypothetical protein